MLLNINTNRLFWHSGAGIDSNKIFDRYKNIMKKIGTKSDLHDKKINKYIIRKWKTISEQL